MPTGYTADVATGKMTDFREYALQCARAFGACIMLRDEPLSSEIPEFEPSAYHAESIEKAKAELSRLGKMTAEECEAAAKQEYKDRLARKAAWFADRLAQRERYEAMLAKAKAYKPPTPDHQNYAAFLVSQLEESIKFDCGDEYWDDPIEQLSSTQWFAKRFAETKKNIEYHKQKHAEELERTRQRNEWVKAVKESLADPARSSEDEG